MPPPRKITAEQELAVREWFAERRRYEEALRCMGSIQAKAKELGISVRTLYVLADREAEELRRKCRVAGVPITMLPPDHKLAASNQ